MTELRKTEERLRDAEEKYHALVNGIKDSAIFLLDPDGRVVSWYEGAERINGYRAEEILGKHFAVLYPGDDVKKGRPAAGLAAAAKQGRFEENGWRVRKAGGWYWSHTAITRILDEKGRVSGFVNVSRDITEVKRSEELLREREELYRTLIETSPGAIIVTDLDTNIVMVNQQAALLLGLGGVEEAFGESIFRFVVERDRQRILHELEDMLYRKIRNKEYVFVRKDGTTFIGELSASVVMDDRNVAKYYTCVISDVTERRVAEEKIKRSAEEWRTTFDSIDDMISIIDKDLRILRVNKTCADFFNARPELLVGKTCYEGFHNRQVRCPGCVYDEVVRTRKTVRREFFLPGNGGAYFEQSISPVLNEKREVIGSVRITKDITRRKKADEELRLFSEAVEKALDGVQIIDLDGHIIYSNKAVGEMYGYSVRELKNRHVSEMNVDPDFAGRVIIPSIKKTGKWAGELMVKRKDGTTFPIWLNASLVETNGRKPIAMMGIIKDITEQKAAEEKIKHAAEEWRTTFDSITDIIAILDKDLRITRVNRACAHALRIKPRDAVGKHCFEVFHHDKQRHPQCPFDKVLHTKKALNRELFDPATNVYTEDSVSPLLDDKGDLVGLIHVMKDITERKKADEILRRDKDNFEKLVNERTRELLVAQRDLEEAKRLSDIGTLAATVAHELRNPLGVIRTAVYNVKKKNQNPTLEGHLANIDKKILESDQIINNLLFYSRIRMPNFENLRIVSLLEECLAATRDRFHKWTVGLEARTDRIRDDYVEADSLQMTEVFNNILSNAYESLEEKQGQITVEAGADARRLWISFQDSGSGIDPKDLGHLTEPFFTRKSRGTGLGLTVCHQIVNLHGGKIAIESEKGKGTKVTILLPKRRTNNEQENSHGR